MKKLLLLFLAVAGMTSTASAKTIYLANNWDKSNIWVGVGNTDNDDNLVWTQLVKIGNNGSDVYSIDLGNSSKFHITFQNSGDGNTGTGFLNSSDYTDGYCYSFGWDNATILTSGSSITVYTYNFNVTTHDTYSNLKIYPYYENAAIGWDWNSAPTMSKDANVYTYTIEALYSSINVIFLNDEDGQTGDLWAASGDNTYYIASMTSTKNDTYQSFGRGVQTNSFGYATAKTHSPLSIPSGYAFFATDDGDGTATAHTLTNPGASVPMLVKGNANTVYAFAAANNGTDDTSENAFIAGSDANVESGSGPYNYILNGDTWYAANGKWVGADKVYLQLSAQTPAGARVLKFADDEVSGISVIENAQAGDNYFDLQGRRVAQPTKGLYIVNGKKVIKK